MEGGPGMTNQHVVPQGGIWQVKGEHATKATKNFDRQSDAIDYARSIAKNNGLEVVIHSRDGRIRDKDSYGNDPCPPIDKVH